MRAKRSKSRRTHRFGGDWTTAKLEVIATDLVRRLLHVRRSKNESSHRVIPLNSPAIGAIARMLDRADLLGHTEPDPSCGQHANGAITTPRSRC
jgi:hypothetical protein